MIRSSALAVLVAARAAHADPAFTADLTLGVDLDHQYEGKALSLSPDLWVYLPHGVTVGAITSAVALDRIDASGDSVCIDKATDVCTRALHGGGVDARVRVRDWIAPRVRLLVRDVDPWKPAATFGALIERGLSRRWRVWTDPYVRVGLANTDRGNRAALVVPVFVELAAWNRWTFAFHTGYESELVGWRDDFHIPTALRVRFAATEAVTVGFEGGLRSAIGPQNSSGYRALLLTASFTPR